MSQNYWLIILFVATMVCNKSSCRPRDVDLANIRPVYRSEKQDSSNRFVLASITTQPEEKYDRIAQDSKFNIESIATVARASSNVPSAPSQAVLGHFVDAMMSQMVESDIRTPPKLKEILKEKNAERKEVLTENFKPMPVTFVYEDDEEKQEKIAFAGTEKVFQSNASQGKASPNSSIKITINDGAKGVAIPVVMDDADYTTEPMKKMQKISETAKPAKEEKKKNGITKTHITTTPSSGLSTWILLSDNRDVTTQVPKRTSNNNSNYKKDGNAEEKKKTGGAVSTTKKAVKVQMTTIKASIPAKKVTQKTAAIAGTNAGTKKPETETTATSALEALVKTQKKGLSTTPTTTLKPKTTESKTSGQKKPQTDSKKKSPEKTDTIETRDKVQTIPPHTALTTEDSTSTGQAEQNSSSSAPENTSDGTNKKKKSSQKKKKKNKKKKKPDTAVEPKIPGQAVGSQIYNFLSREIVPTVGLGLIGVALTAGLASFLGYNPFVSQTVPLRRTYETNHGYSPSNYYNYNTDFSDGGQSEEVLLREVLSGMPEESRYGFTHGETGYTEMHNRNDQSYDRMKTPVYSTQTGNSYKVEKETVNYDAIYSQDYPSGGTYDVSDKKYSSDYTNEKYPVYTRETGSSFVYPETPPLAAEVKSSRPQNADLTLKSTKSADHQKYAKTNPDTIEKQPEALYRVSGELDAQYRNEESAIQGINNSKNNWHRIGTPMESLKQISRVEPGPRSLDLFEESRKPEEKKRTKREIGDNIQRIARNRTKKESDLENEIDFGDSMTSHDKVREPSIAIFPSRVEVIKPEKESITLPPLPKRPTENAPSPTKKFADNYSESTDDKKEEEEETTEPYQILETTSDPVSNASFLDILKRLAQFKLRLGLNFLRSTTDMFSRYLEVIQRKVDESFTNATTVHYNRRKSPWSRIFFGGKSDKVLERRKRSALRENPLLASLLAEEVKSGDRYSKSTKKELKSSSGKMFFVKKSAPKKYEHKTSH